jgi:hypothetical protein
MCDRHKKLRRPERLFYLFVNLSQFSLPVHIQPIKKFSTESSSTHPEIFSRLPALPDCSSLMDRPCALETRY